MRDDEFQKALDTWAESEKESAPDLRPTAEMVRLVRAKQEPRRTPPISSRWAVAGAAAVSLVLVAALFALLLSSGVIPGWLPTPETPLIAMREGPGELPTVIVQGGGKGPGGKGPSRGQAAFRQLVLETQQQDSPIVQAVDLLSPPEEILVLTPADDYRLVLEPVEGRHVYVYQLTSSGSLVQLFPNPAYSAAPNPLPPGQLTLLPAEPNWLYLDGSPGEERLYVVASPQPLQDLDDLYAQYTQQPEAARKREVLSDLLDVLQTLAGTHPGSATVEFVFQHR
jgi:hypothetical protein